ncbi:MAG: sialidase family protein [Thermoplasmatota archaeon]
MARTLPTLALTALAVLAGCVVPTSLVTPQSASTTMRAAPSAYPIVAAFNTIMDTDGGQGEPSMGIAPNGDIFADSATNFGPLQALRSTDGGHTWKSLGIPLAPYPDYDPDLAVSSDGSVWLDELTQTETPAGAAPSPAPLCAAASVSRDSGNTWSQPNPYACFPPGSDRQYIIPTKGGEAYMYLHQNEVEASYQGVSKTTDYGATWTPQGWGDGPTSTNPSPDFLASGSDWGGGGFWNAKTGSVYMTFTYFTGQFPQSDLPVSVPGLPSNFSWHPAYSVSHDGGKTWHLAMLPTAGGAPDGGLSLVVGAADSAGNVYIAWAEADGKDQQDMHVYLAVSKDDGGSWSKPVQIDVGNHSKIMPAITAGAPGHVAVAYYEADEHGYPTNLTLQAHWNITLAWTADALAATPTFEHGQMSTHTPRLGTICADGDGCYRSRQQLLDYFALKTTPDGRVASVWTSTQDQPGTTVNVFGITALPLLGNATAANASPPGSELGIRPPMPLSVGT